MVTDSSEEFVVTVLDVHLSTSQLLPVQTYPSGGGKASVKPYMSFKFTILFNTVFVLFINRMISSVPMSIPIIHVDH